jgi:hypothetical protein
MSKTFELVYSTQKTGYEAGRHYSNPRFFMRPRAGVTKVIVVGNWPNVVSAYKRAGVPVEVIRAPRMSGEDPTPAPKKAPAAGPLSDAAIPEDWADLAWPEKRVLAQHFADQPVINGEQADVLIEAELARRAAGSGAQEHPTEEVMREAIKEATGRMPHPAMGMEKLREQYKAAKAAKSEPQIAAGGGSSAGGAQ